MESTKYSELDSKTFFIFTMVSVVIFPYTNVNIPILYRFTKFDKLKSGKRLKLDKKLINFCQLIIFNSFKISYLNLLKGLL
jgi:hypothetical protein